MRSLVVLLLLFFLAGCASPLRFLPAPSLSEGSLLSGARVPFRLPDPPHDGRWLEAAPPVLAIAESEWRPDRRRLEQLVNALVLDEKRGAVRYHAAATLSAADVYRQRRANCLGFAVLAVSFVRALGYDARFQRVILPPDWNYRDNTLVTRLHVNVRVRLRRGDDLELDWGPGRRAPSYPRELLSDDRALAEFHNNLGVEAMLAGDAPAAFASLRRAVRLAPDEAHLWSNLAVFYRRLGDARAAEAAWLQALQRDPHALPSLSALQRLYTEQGRKALARGIAGEVETYRRRNPFYHYALARDALEHGNAVLARQKILAALALRDDERFRVLQDQILEHLKDDVGDPVGG